VNSIKWSTFQSHIHHQIAVQYLQFSRTRFLTCKMTFVYFMGIPSDLPSICF